MIAVLSVSRIICPGMLGATTIAAPCCGTASAADSWLALGPCTVSSYNSYQRLATSNRTSGYTLPPLAELSTARQAFSNISWLCSLHWMRARWISLGLRAWAWGRHERASSDAARTMLGSRPRDARSDNDATSCGVR